MLSKARTTNRSENMKRNKPSDDKPKSRDPFQQHAVRRLAGAHGKPYKTKRQQDKIALKRGDFSLVA